MKTRLKLLAVLFFLVPAFSAVAAEMFPPVVDLDAEKKHIVVIDPGHGGGDWGIAAGGAFEKTITLETAKKLKEKLEKTEKDISVFLTREEDDYITAENRAGSANANAGSIFISLHCDWYDSPDVGGYKVYYMAYNRKPQHAAGGGLKPWDSAQAEFTEKSRELSTTITRYMQAALLSEDSSRAAAGDNDVLPLGARREKGIDSVLLRGVTMPAVIVELGNMNNRYDLSQLKDSKVINKIAYHLKEGIVHYLRDAEGER